MTPFSHRFAVGLVISCLTWPALAHDFWIQPSTFRPEAGQAVRLDLKVGERYAGESLARNGALLERFVAVGPAGETVVEGVDGRLPAGVVKPSEPGIWTIGYRSRDSVAEMSAEIMDVYIEEEMLADQLGDGWRGKKTYTDSFSRSVKSLLLVGAVDRPGAEPGEHAGFDRRLGLTLELVPLKDPHILRGGGKLRLQLLYEGEPAAGIHVIAHPRAAPETKVSSVSDDDGKVSIELSRGGEWLIKAVKIHPAPAGVEADFQSIWTTLTFAVPES